MSNTCRKCGGAMPADRKGHEQFCPKCISSLRLVISVPKLKEIRDQLLREAKAHNTYTDGVLDICTRILGDI